MPPAPADRSDLLAMGSWVADCLEESDQLVARTVVRKLVAEIERQRRANLVHAVLHGIELDDFITAAIDREEFDRVPWLVAAKAITGSPSPADPVGRAPLSHGEAPQQPGHDREADDDRGEEDLAEQVGPLVHLDEPGARGAGQHARRDEEQDGPPGHVADGRGVMG